MRQQVRRAMKCYRLTNDTSRRTSQTDRLRQRLAEEARIFVRAAVAAAVVAVTEENAEAVVAVKNTKRARVESGNGIPTQIHTRVRENNIRKKHSESCVRC